MQRVFIAIVLFLFVMVVGQMLVALLRRTNFAGLAAELTVAPMRRISFFLLAALILYVAFVGAS